MKYAPTSSLMELVHIFERTQETLFQFLAARTSEDEENIEGTLETLRGLAKGIEIRARNRTRLLERVADLMKEDV